jgi:DNA polymerase (family X)
LRRWHETISKLEFVAGTSDSGRLLKRMQSFPLITKWETPAQDQGEARLANGMRVSLRCYPADQFPCALLWHTGSAEHLARLQAIAEERGMELSENGLRKGRRFLKVETEADIYEHLGLPYMPPEVRENAGEFEQVAAGENFDDLLRIEHIQGMTHCHTVYSDGKDSIEAMARAAEKMGMKYITITDHSPAAHYAGGLDVDRLKRQWAEIEEVQERVDVKLLRGTESDILADGALDYPDHILEQFDIIIASIHSRMKMDEEAMTKRLVNCMRKKQFKVWGHALGRLVLRRPPLVCNVEAVLDAVAESRAAIEVNGDPYRLDMAPEWIRKARLRGIPFIVSVDAHSTGALNYISFGVEMARRGGLRKQEVLNTRPVSEFAAAVKP